MLKIGNVVSEFELPFKYNYLNYNNIIQGNQLPNLIVGFDLATKLFGEDNVDTTSMQAGGQDWTCSPETDGYKHASDLDTFIQKCINFHIKRYKLCVFDFYQNGFCDDFVLSECKVLLSENVMYVRRNFCIYVLNPLYFKDFKLYLKKWKGKFELVKVVKMPFYLPHFYQQLCFI